ncbi:MAG: AMP-binding protein [Polyangiaceae bacterium]|nr:AMP-binding protein [Polyangiaceae bacterium]
MDALKISHAATEFRDRPFLVADDLVWTFAEACSRALGAQQALSSMGASSGRGIAFEAKASPSTIVTVLAALEAGIPFAPLHPKWTRDEAARALSLLPDPIHVDPELLARKEAASSAVAPTHHSGPESLAARLFTSGTSAAPKVVELPRRAFVASARAHTENLPFVDGDRWLLAMPLSHVGGLSIVTRALGSGTAIVLRPSFDVDDTLATIASCRVTLASFVPAMLPKLLSSDGDGRLRSLRAVLVGGAAFPAEIRRASAEAGVPALATYGLTETCSQIATQRLLDARDPSSLDSGTPLHGVEARIDTTSSDGLGRIFVRGDMVMLGYLGHPTIDHGGWLDTGDVGSFDERGRLVVVGRADDTIVTGGENVHPADVERDLAACEGVVEVAVFGVPDPVWGQVVAAALVLAPGFDPEHLLRSAARALSSFKRPRRFIVVDRIATSPNGKVSRRALADSLAARLRPMSYGADDK